jgi:hypothetical protein
MERGTGCTQRASPAGSESSLAKGYPTTKGILGSSLWPQDHAQDRSQNSQHYCRKFTVNRKFDLNSKKNLKLLIKHFIFFTKLN